MLLFFDSKIAESDFFLTHSKLKYNKCLNSVVLQYFQTLETKTCHIDILPFV